MGVQFVSFMNHSVKWAHGFNSFLKNCNILDTADAFHYVKLKVQDLDVPQFAASVDVDPSICLVLFCSDIRCR